MCSGIWMEMVLALCIGTAGAQTQSKASNAADISAKVGYETPAEKVGNDKAGRERS